MDVRFGYELASSVVHSVGAALGARVTGYRRWPNQRLLLDEPLALAESRTDRLRRIYDKAAEQIWDGPQVFRDAVAKHGGIQLSQQKRHALAHVIGMLTWGELAAWTVSADLAEQLEAPDARMAASSQVFDEARHFYVLRDYLALLHVPVPPIDPYFAIAARTLLSTRDLTLKLFAMQILAEGTAQAMFGYLARADVEPVLSELLPLIERDEARHVGLGILHLPELLQHKSPRELARLSRRIHTIGDLLAATQMRYIPHYHALGLDARELMRRADALLSSLSRKLGTVPGTGRPYFRVDDPADDDYDQKLDFVLPKPGAASPPLSRVLFSLVDLGARALPS
jgi:hypothetical protein